MKTVSLLIVIVAQIGCLFAEDDSARCYASLETDSVMCKFHLLSTKPVQAQLKLTQKQIKSLKSFMRGPLIDTTPGLAELRRSKEEKLGAALTDEERSQIHKDAGEKAMALYHSAKVAMLDRTLTPAQAVGLKPLLLQMKGPHAILEDTNLIQQLGLSEEQTVGLRAISDEYKELVAPLQRRRVGLEINSRRPKSNAEVVSEIRNLIRVIRDIERDQDYELLLTLKSEQRDRWENLCGERVGIHWKPSSIRDVPFGEKKGCKQ